MDRDIRKGQNEAWFRDVNERLEDRAAARLSVVDQFEIVCECALEECTEHIELGFDEYEHVRTDGRAFIVVTGHVDLTCEELVEVHEGYQVVRKFGDAGTVAEVANPRSG